MKLKFLKYLPDLLILIGINIFTYNFLRPIKDPLMLDFGLTNYFTKEKVIGIMLIAIGINIAIRYYFNSEKHETRN